MKNLFAQPHTTAQIVLFHSAESAGLSALLTIMTAAGQEIILHGLNWAALGSVLSISFLAQMSMIYKSLANNPQTGQAIADTAQQIASQVAPSNQPGWPPIVHVDVPSLAQQLAVQMPTTQIAAQLRDELVKVASQQQAGQKSQTPLPVPAQPSGVTTPLNQIVPGPGTMVMSPGATVPTWMQ